MWVLLLLLDVVTILKKVTPIGYEMNHLEELKRISDLTTNLANHMILSNIALDEAAVQLIKYRQQLDEIIYALERDAGDENA